MPDIDQRPDPPREVQEVEPDFRELGWSSSALSRFWKSSLLMFRGFLGLSPAPPRPLPTPAPSTSLNLKPPPAVYDDGSVRSIASLGSFPEPPTHFPIPPLTTSFPPNSATNRPIPQHNSSSLQSDGPLQIRTSSDVSGPSSGQTIALPRVTESPIEESAISALKNESIEPPQAQAMMPPTAPTSGGKNGTSAAAEHPGLNSDVHGEAKIAPSPPTSNIESGLRPVSVSSSPFPVSETQQRQQPDPSPATINSRTSSSTGASSTFKRGDYLEDREFGVDNSTDAVQLKAKTLDSAQRRVEGSDASKGSGSVVAAIRDKYTRAVSGYFSPPGLSLKI